MKKRIAALLLAAMLLSLGSGTFALGPDNGPTEVMPMLIAFTNFSPIMSVSGTTASYSLRIIAANDVTSISATLQLHQKLDSGLYKSYGRAWTVTSDTYYLYTSGTKTVDSDYEYRLYVAATPYYGTTAGTTEYAYSSY